jgi:hypothetical protein
MGEYIPVAPINEEAKKHNQNLPGMGGVYNYINLHVYHYAGNNPVKLTDPDGRSDDEHLSKIHKNLTKGYKTPQKAAVAVLKELIPISKSRNIEFGGYIYKDAETGLYYFSEPQEGTSAESVKIEIPLDLSVVGAYHTYGEYSIKDPVTGLAVATGTRKKDDYNSDNFSTIDKNSTVDYIIKYIIKDLDPKDWDTSFRSYLGTPGGIIKEFNPFKIGSAQSRVRTLRGRRYWQ